MLRIFLEQYFRLNIFFLLMLTLILVNPEIAHSASVRMEYTLGFNGHFKLKEWTPLTIVLENRGQNIDGSLEVVVTSGSEFRGDIFPTTYSLQVELPHNSKKLCSFTIFLQTITHAIEIRFRKGNKIAISSSVDLRPLYTEKNLAIVVDSAITPDFLATLPEELFTSHVPARYLPEKWFGYDGVGMLFFNPQEFRGLRERQFLALKEWVRRGGLLILSSQTNYGPLLQERMREIMPMKISGHREFFELNSLKTFCGSSLESRNPFFVLKTEIENSNTIIREQDIAILTEKRIGAGKIVFISFDVRSPPFNQWVSRPAFWNQIFTMERSSKDEGIDLLDQEIMELLASNTRASFAGFFRGLVFIIAYLFVAASFYLILLKRKEKRGLYTLYLLFSIVLFSLLSYWIFYNPKKDNPLTYNIFFQLKNDGSNAFASGEYILGLYSMDGATYEMGFGTSGYPLVRRVSETPGSLVPNVYEVFESENGQRIKGNITKWSHIFFSIKSMFEFPVYVHAVMNDKDLDLRIDNRTPFEISNCLIYFDNRLLDLANILPHQEKSVLIKDDIRKNQNEFSRQKDAPHYVPGKDVGTPDNMEFIQKSLKRDILLDMDSRYGNDPTCLQLIGWVRSGIIKPDFRDNNIDGEGITFIHWKVPIRKI